MCPFQIQNLLLLMLIKTTVSYSYLYYYIIDNYEVAEKSKNQRKHDLTTNMTIPKKNSSEQYEIHGKKMCCSFNCDFVNNLEASIILLLQCY